MSCIPIPQGSSGSSKEGHLVGHHRWIDEDCQDYFFLVKMEFIFPLAFPISKPYLSLKNTQRHLKIFLYRFLGMPIAMVMVRSLSDQRFVR